MRPIARAAKCLQKCSYGAVRGVFIEVVVDVTTHHVRSFPEVENVPQIDDNGGADCEDRENAVYFGTPGASHEYTSRNEPSPPLRRERTVGR